MRAFRDLIKGDGGAAAVEFALVLPMFLALIFAIVSFGGVLFAYTQLHFSTEDAARCYAVKTDVCDTAAHTRTYALGHYIGPNINVDFPAASITQTGACHGPSGAPDGHSVSGSGTYSVNFGLFNFTIPMTATACFP